MKVYFVVWRVFLTYVQVGPRDHKKLKKKPRWNAVLEKCALHCWPKTRNSRKNKTEKSFNHIGYAIKDKSYRFFRVWHLPNHVLISARQQLDGNKNCRHMRLPTFARSLKIVKTQKNDAVHCWPKNAFFSYRVLSSSLFQGDLHVF